MLNADVWCVQDKTAKRGRELSAPEEDAVRKVCPSVSLPVLCVSCANEGVCVQLFNPDEKKKKDETPEERSRRKEREGKKDETKEERRKRKEREEEKEEEDKKRRRAERRGQGGR